MRSTARPTVVDYLFAAGVAAVAVSFRWLLDPWLGDRLPLVTLFAAVAVSVWLGGWRAGVLAALLGYFACDYLFQEPRGRIGLFFAHQWISFLAYVISCTIIIAFGQAMHAAQIAARERGEQLRITLASIGDAVISTDLEARVSYLNAVAETLTGWRRGEAAGQPLDTVFRVLNERTRELVENPALRALREGIVVGLANHSVLVARDGTERPIDDSAAPIRDDEGRVSGCVLVFRDVTERRRAETAQTRLAAIVDSSEDAIISKSLDGVIQAWNASAERLYGWTAAEAVGQSITLIVPPELQAEERGILERLRRGERIEHFETVRVAKSGHRLDVSLTVSPVHDAEGRIIGASKMARDIRGRKRAESDLLAAERQLQIVTDSMSAPVARCSRDLRYLWVSKHLAEWLGKPAEEFVGRPIVDIVGEEALASIRPHIEQVLAGQEVRFEARIPYRDLGPRWISAVYTPTFDAAGVPDGWVAVVLDIEHRKQVEEDLRQADRRKDEFLATLAHELRNPLAPVRNSLEIMKRAPEDAALVGRARDTMDRQVSQMERLIDDLLDVSRITRNRLELRKETVALAPVLHQAVEACRPLAVESEHQVVVTTPPEPIHVEADPVRLAQIFGNLIHNACKYTRPGGRIEVRAERRDGEAVISVADNGIGIPPEMLPHIFEMFTQVDPTLERSQGGLGIGLTLVRQLVGMHGGRVEARSDGAGRGSTFAVYLPVSHDGATRRSTSKAPARRVASPPRRILVVDDNRDSAETLAMLLKLSGHETALAYDGLEAIAAAERFRPDVLLLDIGLPKLNGFDACRRIREHPWGKPITIVALTGWGQEEDRRRSNAAGFDSHLVKPVDPTALAELLAALPADRAPRR